ncbi:MAG TPA: methyltransferase [Pseudonocardia sp.]|jgi:hypothetical protein|nr:methyltransferase [Pseudonocardia sp.]
MTQTKPPAPDTRADGTDVLLDWLHGAKATWLLDTVTRMKLAEVIGDRVADLTELARHYGIPPDRMLRLMRAVTDLGVCAEHRPGGYALTALGDRLRPGHPGSLHDLVWLYTNPITQRSWSNLEASLRTGRAGFVEAFGMPIFDYLADRPTLATTYHATMGLLTERIAPAVAGHFDFGRFATVTDVGGGDGTMLRAILTQHPGVHGTLVESGDCVASAARVMAAAGVDDRCTITTGDFFDGVPSGSDLYLLKWILHDWDDDRAAMILRRCREAMPARGRIMIIERVLPTTTATGVPRDPTLSDLHMLAIYGGQVRTLTEFQTLFRRSGLRFAALRPLPGVDQVCLIEAVAG